MIVRVFILYSLIVSLSFLNGVNAQSARAQIEGSIAISQSSGDSLAIPGTIRFNHADNDFEGWNGLFWVSLSGGLKYTLDTISDIEGHICTTVIIGTQEWMAENLRTGTYHDGTPIPNLIDSSLWATATIGAWCWYGNSPSFEVPYGKLYNWFTLNNAHGLCPAGWHVPGGPDWSTLINLLAPISVAGGKMKEPGLYHWSTPNTGAPNVSGFTGLPGGQRTASGSFQIIHSSGNWWSSTTLFDPSVSSKRLSATSEDLIEFNFSQQKEGMSVRCVRN